MKKILVCSSSTKEAIVSYFILIIGFIFVVMATFNLSKAWPLFFIGLSFILGGLVGVFYLKLKFIVYEDGTLELIKPSSHKSIKFKWEDIKSIKIESFEKISGFLNNLLSFFNYYKKIKGESIVFTLKNEEKVFFHLYFTNSNKFIKLLLEKVNEEEKEELQKLIT